MSNRKGIYIMVKQMIVRFSIFSVVVILVAFLTKSEAVDRKSVV